MKYTVTALYVLGFVLVVYGLRLVFQQINKDAGWAPRSAAVAAGETPPGMVAYARYESLQPGEKAMMEHSAQAQNLADGMPIRQKGAWIALAGAALALAGGILPLWWK